VWPFSIPSKTFNTMLDFKPLSYRFVLGLWKESLNSNDHQFHQYQQNQQSPFTSTHWTQ
jgi:hypothetical protein